MRPHRPFRFRPFVRLCEGSDTSSLRNLATRDLLYDADGDAAAGTRERDRATRGRRTNFRGDRAAIRSRDGDDGDDVDDHGDGDGDGDHHGDDYNGNDDNGNGGKRIVPLLLGHSCDNGIEKTFR